VAPGSVTRAVSESGFITSATPGVVSSTRGNGPSRPSGRFRVGPFGTSPSPPACSDGLDGGDGSWMPSGWFSRRARRPRGCRQRSAWDGFCSFSFRSSLWCTAIGVTFCLHHHARPDRGRFPPVPFHPWFPLCGLFRRNRLALSHRGLRSFPPFLQRRISPAVQPGSERWP
jgi:hypothetical protein